MTSPAVLEIEIAAEGSLAIMTSGAGVVSRGEVFERSRRADLSFLRQSGRVVMTIGATETLASAVLRVAEGEAECGRVGGSSAVRLPIVTDAARCQVASISLRVWSMTSVALVMRPEVRRN